MPFAHDTLPFQRFKDNLELLAEYIKSFTEWAEVTEKLTSPETGINDQYRAAKNALDRLSLTAEQIDTILAMPAKSALATTQERIAA